MYTKKIQLLLKVWLFIKEVCYLLAQRWPACCAYVWSESVPEVSIRITSFWYLHKRTIHCNTLQRTFTVQDAMWTCYVVCLIVLPNAPPSSELDDFVVEASGIDHCFVSASMGYESGASDCEELNQSRKSRIWQKLYSQWHDLQKRVPLDKIFIVILRTGLRQTLTWSPMENT